jgi:hypothetical protein
MEISGTVCGATLESACLGRIFLKFDTAGF